MAQELRTDAGIEFPRNSLFIRVFMTVMLLGVCAFFAAMAVLISHHSELRCEPDLHCVHIERYPLGIVQKEAIPRVQSAETQWSPGGRVMAIRLILNHQDGSMSEYQGVGKNGERAQRVAKELNAFLLAPGHEQVFKLREGSLPAAIFLGLLTLGGLVLLPFFFTKVRLTTTDTNVLMKIGRWPARSHRYSVPLDQFKEFSLRRSIVMEQALFTVCADQVGRPFGFDLGMSFRNQEQALQRITELDEWLALRVQRTAAEPRSP